MIKFKMVAPILILALFGSGAIADSTNIAGQEITNMSFDGVGNQLYFETSGKWNATGCNSTYIWIASSVLGQKEILSIGLAAKMANKKVIFSGECDTDANYFKANHIKVI